MPHTDTIVFEYDDGWFVIRNGKELYGAAAKPYLEALRYDPDADVWTAKELLRPYRRVIIREVRNA